MIVARAWGTDPRTIAGLTRAEYDAMVAQLTDEIEARQQAAEQAHAELATALEPKE